MREKYKTAVKTGHNIPNIERISTGILTLDMMLGGGLPLGRIVELFGIESGGKSTIALMMCKAVQEQGFDTVLIDLERTLERDLFENIGVNPDMFLHLNPVYGEEAIDMVLDAAEGGAKLIIVDSLAMLEPKAAQIKIDKDSEAMSMAALPGMMNRLKGKITTTIEKTGACLVFINQIRDKMNSPYGGVQTPGGHAVRHMCSTRVQITHATKDPNKAGIITSHLTAIKNKTGTPALSCSLLIENGIVNRPAALVDGAAEAKLLIKSGSWVKYSDEVGAALGLDKLNIAQGAAKTGEVLAANPELYRMLYYTSLQKHGVPEHQIPSYWRPGSNQQ
jgi:recombination protein RecA